MVEIYFNDIHVGLNRIEVKCKSSGDTLEIDDVLFFEFSQDLIVNDNQIAVALSNLCGKRYDEIYMDLSVNRNILENINSFVDCEVRVREIIEEDFVNDLSEDNIMIGFSGGLDSLADYTVLKNANIFKNVYLVSLDFQGRFSREEEFFKRFNPFIVRTNLVDLGLNINYWSFMYIPQIFFSSYLDAKYITISGQFHAGEYGFDERFTLLSRTDQVPIEFMGMERIQFSLGLSAIGSALVNVINNPELIDFSLKSLANPGEEKRYRKQMLVEILSNKYGKNVFLERVNESRQHKWGTRISLDFVCMYVIKNSGIEEASKIMSDIPNEVVEFVNSISLDFYEKYNINFLNSIPSKFRLPFLQSLVKCGIYPYNSVDWKEYFAVSEFLSDYYPDLRRRLNK